MSNDSSFVHAGCQVGTEWRVVCNTYDDTTPILTVIAGISEVSITPRGKVATKAAVEFARALLRETQKFAYEIERMHTAQLDGGTKAAGSDAA